MTASNQWIDRFERINSPEMVRKLSARNANRLCGLEKDPTGVACSRIEKELEEIFVPTQRSIEIMLELIQCALAHSHLHYPNVREFMKRCYESELSLEPFDPIILSGPAGTGKSQLSKALMRVLGSESLIQPDPNHAPFPLVSARRLRNVKAW